ncbi:CopG family transcriptional regulator [Cupriavidus basilensis]
MAVVPRAKPVSVEAFIGGAPDAGAGATAPVAAKEGGGKSIRKAGKKNIITVSIDPVVLDELDTYAVGMGMSRAAVITYAVKRLLKDD